MLKNEVMLDKKTLAITPEGSLKTTDFERLAKEVDPHIEAMGTLNGLMIYSESFPGWENFTEVLSHIRFVKDNHHLIKKVAVVTDSEFLSALPRAASHFYRAEIKHFCYQDKDVALDWLKSSDS
jgi:hypothetical protein